MVHDCIVQNGFEGIIGGRDCLFIADEDNDTGKTTGRVAT